MILAAQKIINVDGAAIYANLAHQRNKTGLPGKRQPSLAQSCLQTARGDLTVRTNKQGKDDANTMNGKSAIQFYSTANTNVEQE